MDQRLLVTLEVAKDAHKFTFSLQYGAPVNLAYQALDEFKAQVMEWEKAEAERQKDQLQSQGKEAS